MSWRAILIKIAITVVSGLILTIVLFLFRRANVWSKRRKAKKANEFHLPPCSQSREERKAIERRANEIAEEIEMQLKKESTK